MNDISGSTGVNDAAFATLCERVKHLTEQMVEVRKDVGDMKQMADRYRGAFLLIVGLGGLVGSLIGIWDKLWSHQ